MADQVLSRIALVELENASGVTVEAGAEGNNEETLEVIFSKIFDLDRKMATVLDRIFEQKRSGDAGIDLYVGRGRQTLIETNKVNVIRIGYSVDFPKDHFGRISDRSSVAKFGMYVVGGIVDNNYTGEISILMVNKREHDVLWDNNKALAQMVVQKCPTLVVTTRFKNTNHYHSRNVECMKCKRAVFEKPEFKS